MKSSYTVERINQGVLEHLSTDDSYEIENILNLSIRPQYFSAGRTGYYTLKKPICIDGIIYTCVKFKGIGYGEPNTSIWYPPGTKYFYRDAAHFGFSPDGVPVETFSDIAPFGGILYSRALNEFNAFEQMRKNNISCLCQYLVVKYDSIFKGIKEEHLGCVVSLCEDNPPIRMGKLLIDISMLTKEELIYLNSISQLILSKEYTSKTQFDLWQHIARLYASNIRKMNEAGIYLHSGGWHNIQFSLQRKDIVLVDVDATRMFTELNPKIHALYALRDLVSCIYWLLGSLNQPEIIHVINADVLNDYNFVYYLLSGYLENSNRLLYSLSKKITKYYIESCFIHAKEKEKDLINLTKDELDKYELKKMDFFDYCFQLIYPAFLMEKSNTINHDTIKEYIPFSISCLVKRGDD